jgi:hypothetical protein
MAIDFPDSPTDRQLYQYNRLLYIYDADKSQWRVFKDSVINALWKNSNVTVSEEEPDDPQTGDVWIYYNIGE